MSDWMRRQMDLVDKTVASWPKAKREWACADFDDQYGRDDGLDVSDISGITIIAFRYWDFARPRVWAFAESIWAEVVSASRPVSWDDLDRYVSTCWIGPCMWGMVDNHDAEEAFGDARG
jgi:hypothetical protein